MIPLVIAHRGASAYEPENSLAAFRAALAMQADGVELDVHATADGAIVVHHDAEVAGRAIADMAAADLDDYRLANGEAIPTLGDVLVTLGPDVVVYVEVKGLAPEHDAALRAVLNAAPDPRHVHVHAFDHRIVRRLVTADPSLVGGVLSASYPIDPLVQLDHAGAHELWQQEHLVDADLVRGVHEADRRLIAWTVDRPERMTALRTLGVDGICTNTPDIARRTFA